MAGYFNPFIQTADWVAVYPLKPWPAAPSTVAPMSVKTGCQACPQRAQIATEIEAQRRADRHVGAPLQEHLASRPKQANHPVSARVPRSSGKALESSTKTLAICAPFSLLDTNKLALGNLNDCRAGANFLIH
jgi:hypothetical protein